MTNLLMNAKGFVVGSLMDASSVVDTVTKTDDNGAGTFKGLEDILLNLGNDGYALLTTAGVIVTLLCFVAALIMLSVNKQTAAKAENKNQLVTILFVVAGIFCAGTIVALAAGIGSSVK